MKPLTNGMIDFLMDCHEREMMSLFPNHGTMRSAADLIKRKLLTTGVFKEPGGKKLICLYTTTLGRAYLNIMMKTIFPNRGEHSTIFMDLIKT